MTAHPRPARLVCFDVDGTLIEHRDGQTVWQLLNSEILADPETNRRRFAAFRDGRISYAEWVTLDLLDWKSIGVDRQRLARLIEQNLYLVDGVRETFDSLRARGIPIALVSGTIDLVLELICGDLLYDRVFSNKIFFDAEGRIQTWEATPYDVRGKAAAIELLAADYGITVAECAFVGDGWNDLHAFECAGQAVAFRPKLHEVGDVADHVIVEGPLTRLFEFVQLGEGGAGGRDG